MVRRCMPDLSKFYFTPSDAERLADVSKVGKVPIYDDATADWVKNQFRDAKVFTTIESGSYCVLRWNFEKPVFLDGFFAPHTRSLGCLQRGPLKRHARSSS